MRRGIAWVLATLVLAGVIHLFFVWMIPRWVMWRYLERSTQQVGWNHIVHSKRPDATARTVVMPSPDMVYSACPYDVSAQAVHVRAQVPETYWSMAAFASNTDNFFVVNDQTAGSKQVEYVLVGPGTPNPPTGKNVVRSPTNRGVILFRRLVTDETKLAEVVAGQQTDSCSPK